MPLAIDIQGGVVISSYQVVHVLEDASRANFGVTSALAGLVTHKPEASSMAICTVDATPDVIGEWHAAARSVPTTYGRVWRYSPRFPDLLGATLQKPAVIHIHGMWSAPQFQAANWAIAEKIPFVVTPHNMLGGWIWRRGKLRQLKKTIYWHGLVARSFREATAVHALSDLEGETLREFFPDARIEVIPNGIDMRTEVAGDRGSGPPAVEPYLLFLGRLHPVKGLDMLLKAYAGIEPQSRLPLVVAGGEDSPRYLKSLLGLVEDLELKTVRFVGPVGGEEKWDLLGNAWALCAPSHSEGVSMVSLEALSCGTPILVTNACGFTGLDTAGAGYSTETTPAAIESALRRALAWSDDDRAQFGQAARKYAQVNFSWGRVTALYDVLYRSCLGIE